MNIKNPWEEPALKGTPGSEIHQIQILLVTHKQTQYDVQWNAL